MGKAKSEMKSSKTTEKSHLQSKEKLQNLKTGKKQIVNKEMEEFDGVDSLIVLKDSKERKKLSDIDDRILLLKSELQSLLGDTKPQADCNTEGKNNLGNPAEVEEKPTVLDGKKNCRESVMEFKPGSNSTPYKVTEWLDKTIDETSSQVQTEVNNSSVVKLQAEATKPNRFAQNKVEELLYKTFIVQNCGVHLSELHDTSVKSGTSKSNADQQKCCKSSKACKKPDTVQRKSKRHRVCKRGRKKRIISLHTSESDVEVIDVDTTVMMDDTTLRTEPSCIDLDVSSYDWGEPFDIDTDHGFDSDVELISNSETKCGNTKNEGLKPDNVRQNTSNESINTDSLQPKKGWECPVCFEQSKGQEIVATQCGHVFCRSCLEKHISMFKKNCPTCRTSLRNKPIITLFNF